MVFFELGFDNFCLISSYIIYCLKRYHCRVVSGDAEVPSVQVEFLSMKLAAVNPRLDFNIEDFFGKEMFPACSTSFPTIGMSSEMTNPAYLQFNPAQVVACCGLEMGINSSDMALRRTISAPVSIPETYIDTPCFTQLPPSSTWDADLQNLLNLEFHQGRSTSFPSQPFTGSIEASNLKMEM
ncbi:transcription factor bHLH49-like [Castanea sativa]|uniref:transcription factor bHLH49-like n=1 Tax=Castanea sativa TaxID=21020 RepID=UPI003F6512F8